MLSKSNRRVPAAIAERADAWSGKTCTLTPSPSSTRAGKLRNNAPFHSGSKTCGRSPKSHVVWRSTGPPPSAAEEAASWRAAISCGCRAV